MSLETAPRSTLPLLATALLAALFLVRGISHPQLNYDAIPYAALAKEMRGAGGKPEAYQELASKVGDSGFQLYVSGSYRERMYRDDEFFRASMPLYTIRPFYIFLCSIAGSLLHDDVAATYIVSAAAAALAVLLSFILAGAVGLKGNQRLAVPVTWIAAGGLNFAGLSTPDAVETLLSLLFILVSLAEPWKGKRALALCLLAALMVATRTDAVLFVAALMALEWLLEPRHRGAAALIFLAALATYLSVQQLSGNHGYVALINFALLERSHDVVPNLVPNPHGYVLAVVHELLQILGEDFQPALYTLAVCLLTFSWNRERRGCAAGEADAFAQKAVILSAALVAYLCARFVLYPLPLSRYVMNAYVLTGILFARAIRI